MRISYRYGLDHPVGKGFSIFLLVIFLAFGWINIMNAGLYGYAMGVESLWFIFVGIAFMGFDARYGRTEQGWVVGYNWFGVNFKKAEYEDMALVEDGKLFRLEGKVKGVFKPLSIAFNQKQADFFKLISQK